MFQSFLDNAPLKSSFLPACPQDVLEVWDWTDSAVASAGRGLPPHMQAPLLLSGSSHLHGNIFFFFFLAIGIEDKIYDWKTCGLFSGLQQGLVFLLPLANSTPFHW